MLERIERAVERQRQFAGDAAHELRTPRTLQSQIDLALSRARTNAEYRQAIVELNADVNRLTKLVETLLVLARSDGKDVKLDRVPTNPASLMDLIAEQYAESAVSHGIRVTIETAPVTVQADEDLIIQLLVNLMDNAVAHTPSGGTVTLGCGASTDGSSGCGVATPVSASNRNTSLEFSIGSTGSTRRGIDVGVV